MQNKLNAARAAEEKREPAIAYVHTTEFPELLRKLNLSLIVTTYQAQRILTFAPKAEKLQMLMRVFPRPTGLAVQGRRMALCSKNQIWLFEDAGTLRDKEGNAQPYDLCFTPRTSFVTGDILGHEISFFGKQLLIVNTRFSCICTPSEHASFTPVWRPRFISALVPEDRCHLNGMALDQSGIRYVTALAESDTAEGWRPLKRDGGIIIDYRSGEIISRGLSMPHSPRLHGGKLWVLNSGEGELQVVDPANGNRQAVVRLPGFLRGLAFHGKVAFVGVCKIREKKTFGDLPIESRYPELECAIYCIDLSSARILGCIRFMKGIEELFDFHALPGVTSPHIVGFEENTIDGLYVLSERSQSAEESTRFS